MDSRLLSLLQVTDSIFPVGTFTQSYGLETYVLQGAVHSRATLRDFAEGHLRYSVGSVDTLAMRLTWQALEEGVWEEIRQVDEMLSAQKSAREPREGSIKVGRRMLRLAETLFPSPAMAWYREMIDTGGCDGHHAVVFGLVAGQIGLSVRDSCLAFLYSAAAALISNALRLMPLGQNDGQTILKELQPLMVTIVDGLECLTAEDIGSGCPALEIRTMQHETVYSRLFMS